VRAMGGGFYDREVEAPTQALYSANASQVFVQKETHETLKPFQRALNCTFADPIVCCVDVTGSMGKWSKVIWDKLPMFFGQLKVQNYLQDPAFSFCAVGDAYGDKSALQVGNFAQGNDLDTILSRIHIEGGGVGPQGGRETYELAAYYYARCCHISEEAASKPYFFFTGDEGFYPNVSGEQVKTWITGEAVVDMPSLDILKELCEKFNVLLLHKTLDYGGPDDDEVVAMWSNAIGANNVILLNNPKSCVDVMLGIIAVKSGTRTLDKYMEDMRDRGQTEERINEVKVALSKF